MHAVHRKHNTTKKGEDSSEKARQFFKEGLKDLFPNLKQDLVDLTWSSIRCGLFHNGMTGDGIFLNTDEGNQLEIALFKINNEDKVLINPHKFLDKVKSHFQKYISKLKDNANTELRNNFEKRLYNYSLISSFATFSPSFVLL